MGTSKGKHALNWDNKGSLSIYLFRESKNYQNYHIRQKKSCKY